MPYSCIYAFFLLDEFQEYLDLFLMREETSHFHLVSQIRHTTLRANQKSAISLNHGYILIKYYVTFGISERKLSSGVFSTSIALKY